MAMDRMNGRDPDIVVPKTAVKSDEVGVFSPNAVKQRHGFTKAVAGRPPVSTSTD